MDANYFDTDSRERKMMIQFRIPISFYKEALKYIEGREITWADLMRELLRKHLDEVKASK